VFHAKVYVTLKKTILDPQGKAVEDGIHSFGYDYVTNVRIGKLIEMDIDVSNKEEAEKIVREISEKLLANVVMETFNFTVEEVKE